MKFLFAAIVFLLSIDVRESRYSTSTERRRRRRRTQNSRRVSRSVLFVYAVRVSAAALQRRHQAFADLVDVAAADLLERRVDEEAIAPELLV